MDVYPHTLLVCPTLNPGLIFHDWIAALRAQKYHPDKVLIIDSGSGDQTVQAAIQEGYGVVEIKTNEFNHGGTRQKAVTENQEYDLVIFLTQDAILCSPDSLSEIIDAFSDDNIAAACGRQLPRPEAGTIESHARLFNYPENSFVRILSDKCRFGVKTAFLSNSFSAYRVSTLIDVCGFPSDVIFGEDMYVAAKLLKAGYKVSYVADACVYHSHDYSPVQEMKRYFDMGVFHAREPWLRQEFGTAEGEGLKFVISEVEYLLRHAFWRIPEGVIRTVLRYTGFRLGLAERYIPSKIKRKLSMSPGYFI